MQLSSVRSTILQLQILPICHELVQILSKEVAWNSCDSRNLSPINEWVQQITNSTHPQLNYLVNYKIVRLQLCQAGIFDNLILSVIKSGPH